MVARIRDVIAAKGGLRKAIVKFHGKAMAII
jgi:hypothetical protein